MRKKLKSILLLDDNLATNFIHKKFIVEANCVDSVFDFQSGIEALEYLSLETNPLPELIFIDVNMPIMSAWDFLSNFEKLNREGIKNTIIILLSTSLNPNGEELATKINQINGIRLKPLSVEQIKSIVLEFFPNNE